jgi:hypothetical protein
MSDSFSKNWLFDALIPNGCLAFVTLTLGIVPADQLPAQTKLPINPRVLTPIESKSSQVLQPVQTDEKTENSQVEGSADQPVSSEEMEHYSATIQEIRRKMNGGAMEPLAELLGDRETAERQFDEELKRQMCREKLGDTIETNGIEPMPSKLPPNAPPNAFDRPIASPNQLRPQPTRVRPETPYFEYPAAQYEHRRHPEHIGQNRNSGRIEFDIPQPREPEHFGQVEHRGPVANPNHFNHPSQRLMPSHPAREVNHSLRAAARKLEEMAAEFEEVNLYEEADQVRRLAGNIWRKSRSSLKPNAPVR